jgi:DNA repair exonuclease SbcCD ATPase subunit
MIITKLELENWMKIRRLSLEFDRGVNLVYGPNEIGKSSIIEAVRQAITGDAGSGAVQYRQLQSWGTAAAARVDLWFTTGGGEDFRICKSFPGGCAELYLKTVRLTEDAKKTQAKLYDILEVSEKTIRLFDLLFISQGESLSIFDRSKARNPIRDGETLLYIRHMVKETALRVLEEFQGRLTRERDEIFTGGGKLRSGRSASHYSRLLDEEFGSRKELDGLGEQVEELSLRLQEMEVLDKKENRLLGEKGSREKYLVGLRAKGAALEELEKKKLEFGPIENDYRRFREVERQLAGIRENLPRLYGFRGRLIAGLEVDIRALKEKQEQAKQGREALRLKREHCERLEEVRRKFEILEGENRELERVYQQVEETGKPLPGIFDADKQAGEYPVLTLADVTQIRDMAGEIAGIEARLETARGSLKMKFKITPLGGREIRFRLKKDDSEAEQVTSAEPLEITGFRYLNFRDLDRFAIDVEGGLVEVDIGVLEKGLARKKEELAARLGCMKVRSIEELEIRFQEYTILKGRPVEVFKKEYAAVEKEYRQLREGLGRMEPLDIKEVKQHHLEEIAGRLNALDRESADKEKDKALLAGLGIEETLAEESAAAGGVSVPDPRQVYEQIRESRTRLNELEKQEQDFLKGKREEDFTHEYREKKTGLDGLIKSIAAMEPAGVGTYEAVKDGIETVERELSALEKEIRDIRSRRDKMSGELSGFGSLPGDKKEREYRYRGILENLKEQLTGIYAGKLLLKLIEAEKEKAEREIFKPLEERVMGSLDRLIPGMYKFKLDEELGFRLSARMEGGGFKKGVTEAVSYGTKEQLSFLLRLAIAGQLSRKEPQVMILDDSFVNTDTERLPRLLDLIVENSGDIQFLIFTCKEGDYERYKARFHAINLEEAIL